MPSNGTAPDHDPKTEVPTVALQTAQVSVSTTRAELTVEDFGASSIIIQAPAAATLYVGGSAVTSANGFPIAAGQALSLDHEGERIYGVLASGTGTAYVLRSGV
jgi:hypothetical protein